MIVINYNEWPGKLRTFCLIYDGCTLSRTKTSIAVQLKIIVS